jgi:hypothetical protein
MRYTLGMAKESRNFRLNPLHLQVLKALAERMSHKNGTSYSQAQVLEMAIGRMWQQEVGVNIYEAFAKEDAGLSGQSGMDNQKEER